MIRPLTWVLALALAASAKLKAVQAFVAQSRAEIATYNRDLLDYHREILEQACVPVEAALAAADHSPVHAGIYRQGDGRTVIACGSTAWPNRPSDPPRFVVHDDEGCLRTPAFWLE